MRKTARTLTRHLSAGACLALCTSLAAVSPALAKPVKITFTSDITKSSLAGVDAGDTLTIDFLVDNGGDGLREQAWDLDDILSATARVGSVTQVLKGGWWDETSTLYPRAGWQTDDTGTLRLSQFYGTWNPYQLCVKRGISDCRPEYDYYLDADNIQKVGDTDQIAYFTAGWSAYDGLYPQGNWSISEVPLPGTLPLLGAGLLALGLLRRRG